MARIKKTDAEARERYMLEVFKKDPEMSIAKANDKMKAQFGSKVRAQRAYELRAVARKEVGTGASAQSQAGRKSNGKKVEARRPLQAAGRIVNAPQAMTANRGRLVIIEGSESNMSFFKSAVEALNDAGLTNLRIDHATNTYAVVRV